MFTKLTPTIGANYERGKIILYREGKAIIELDDVDMQKLIGWYLDPICALCYGDVPGSRRICQGCLEKLLGG